MFFRKRVDGGVEEILRYGELAGEFGRRKHRSVIVGDEFFEEVPDRAAGVRQINVAAPDPMIRTGLTRVNLRGGLRVVNDHEFGIKRERGAVLLVVGKENLKIPGLGLVRLAV